MGMGDYPAGTPVAGADVIVPSATVAALSSVPKWDPRLRVIVTNADGSVATVHYVDEQVALALGVELGTIPSSPDTGIRLSNIRNATSRNFDLAVRDSVVTALGKLLARRAIALGPIVTNYDPAGRSSWVVNYQNLVVPAQQSRIATVSAR